MTWCGKRRHARGQAMTEIALLLPLLMLLVLGVYTISTLVSAQNSATVATRNGARLASELGGGGWVIGSKAIDPSAIDRQIVATVTQGMKRPNVADGVAVTEVDVYLPDPSKPAGYFDPSDTPPASPSPTPMLIDRYNPDGTPYPGWSSQYTLDLRHDVLGSQSLIGVRVVYTYQPSNQIFGWLAGQRSAYTVMQVQPT